MNKIPVFLHIPKNAGTYVLGVTMELFRNYGISKGWKKELNRFLNLRRILLQKNGIQIATLFVYDPHKVRNINVNFKPVPCDEFCNLVEIDQFEKELRNGRLILFSIIIEDHGTKHIKDGVWDNLASTANASPLYYTIFREIYGRSCSLYNYITSSKSNHETTHNCIKSKTLEEYLSSYELSDSWLIRNLLDISNNQPINQEHFNRACAILDKFKIADIKYTDDLINNVFRECYGIDQKIIADKVIDIDKNSNPINKLDFNQLKEETKKFFLQRTEFDRKIYEKYCSL